MSIGINRPKGIRLHQVETLKSRMDRRKRQARGWKRSRTIGSAFLGREERAPNVKKGGLRGFFSRILSPLGRLRSGI